MTTPPEPLPDLIVQASVGLAETPAGQKVAVMLTILLGRDNANATADAIRRLTEQMSASGLIVAAPSVPVNGSGAAP